MKGKFNVVLLYIVIGKLLDEFFNSARKFFDVSSIMLSLIKISTNFDGEEVSFFSLSFNYKWNEIPIDQSARFRSMNETIPGKKK